MLKREHSAIISACMKSTETLRICSVSIHVSLYSFLLIFNCKCFSSISIIYDLPIGIYI